MPQPAGEHDGSLETTAHHVGTMMPLGDHLEDLRRRLILALLGLLPVVVAALIGGRALLALLLEPLSERLRAAGQAPFPIQLSPLDTFVAYLQLSFVVGILVGSPWLLYQLWKFVAPGLYANERRFVYILIPLSTVLTIASAGFLYFIVLPIIIEFFIAFAGSVGDERTAVVDRISALGSAPVLAGDPANAGDLAVGTMWVNSDLQQLRIVTEPGRVLGAQLINSVGVASMIGVKPYLSLLLTLALAFAVAFQTPVVVLIAGWARIIERRTLGKYRRWAFGVCVILGAVLTPADPLSMLLMAGAMYVLFELGMALLIVFPPGGKWAEPEQR